MKTFLLILGALGAAPFFVIGVLFGWIKFAAVTGYHYGLDILERGTEWGSK